MKKILLLLVLFSYTVHAMDTKSSPIEWDGDAYEKGSDPQYLSAMYFLKKLGVNFTNKNVLDVGCGTGRLLAEALKNGARWCTGADPSNSMLQIVEKKLNQVSPNWDTNQCDAENFNTIRVEYDYDIAMAWFCMHLVRDKHKAFENMFYSLKPGGELVCNITTEENGDPLGVIVLNEFKTLLQQSSEGSANKAVGRSTIKHQELLGMLSEIGFIDIELTSMNLDQFFVLKNREETKHFMLPLVKATPAYNTIHEDNREGFFEKYIDALEKKLDKTGRIYTTNTTLVHARKPV